VGSGGGRSGRPSEVDGERRSGGSADSGRSFGAMEVETNAGGSVGSNGTRSSASSIEK